MEMPVINQQGESVGQVEVSDAIFDVPMNHSLVHQAVVAYQANKRQGTHDTKTRARSPAVAASPGSRSIPVGLARAASAPPNGAMAVPYSAPIPGTTARPCPSE